MRTPLDVLTELATRYANHTAPHRGKARLLGAARRALGVRRVRLSGGIELPLLLDSSMDLSYLRIASGEVHEAAFELIGRLEPGDCFVDVGANVGFHTVLASRAVGPNGRVFAVEPSAREYCRLVRALEWNGCENVVPFRAALGDRPSLARLRVEAHHTGLNHLDPGVERGELVPVFDGDSLFGPLIGSRRTLVKIDVEGAEGPVIQGMRALFARPETVEAVVEVSRRFAERGGTAPDLIYERLAASGLRPTTREAERSDQYDELFVRAEPSGR